MTELAYELKKRGIMLPDGIITKEEFITALLDCVKQKGREYGNYLR